MAVGVMAVGMRVGTRWIGSLPARRRVDGGLAGRTPTGEREVAGLDLEREVAHHRLPQVVENPLRYFGDPAAVVADEVMVVGVLGEVVHSRTMSEPYMIDDPQPLEFVEEPVHRRLRDLRLLLLYSGRDVLGGGVIDLVIDQGLQNRSPGSRCPASTRPDLGQDFVDPSVRVHAKSLIGPSASRISLKIRTNLLIHSPVRIE